MLLLTDMPVAISGAVPMCYRVSYPRFIPYAGLKGIHAALHCQRGNGIKDISVRGVQAGFIEKLVNVLPEGPGADNGGGKAAEDPRKFPALDGKFTASEVDSIVLMKDRNMLPDAAEGGCIPDSFNRTVDAFFQS